MRRLSTCAVQGVIVLCDLEGMTRKEAAQQLGIPEGSVASRLARARAMLAKRLAKRGVTLTGGALAAFFSQNVASAGVPALLVSNAIKAASIFAAGQAAATGAISVKVAALTEGVVKAMFVAKIKAFLSVVLIVGFVATGATLSYSTAAGQDDKKSTVEKPKPTVEKPVDNDKPKDEPPATAKKDVLTPEEVIRLTTDVNQATVEFKVEYVSKSILVKTGSDKDAGWVIGHSPDDLRLRPKAPQEKLKAVFEAILTDKAIKQLNRTGITDVAKHFQSKNVRVTGKISWEHYDGYGTPAVAELVVNDLSQLEVVQ